MLYNQRKKKTNITSNSSNKYIKKNAIITNGQKRISMIINPRNKEKNYIIHSFICRRAGRLARVGPRASTDASESIIGHRDAKGLVKMCGDELRQCGLLERMQVRQWNAVLLAGLSPWCQPQHVHLLKEGTVPDKPLAGTVVVTLQATS